MKILPNEGRSRSQKVVEVSQVEDSYLRPEDSRPEVDLKGARQLNHLQKGPVRTMRHALRACMQLWPTVAGWPRSLEQRGVRQHGRPAVRSQRPESAAIRRVCQLASQSRPESASGAVQCRWGA